MVNKYVLAGGPGAGKSKGIEYLQKSLSQKGYDIYTVQETATELMKSGLDRHDERFPYYNFSLMMYKELLFEKIAKEKGRDAIILCDRGMMDPKAFRGNEVFQNILKQYNIPSEEEVLNSYDAVFFMCTAAEGQEDRYKNSEFRTESVEQARESHQKLLNVWNKHSNFVFINSEPNIEDKLQKLEILILKCFEANRNQKLTPEQLVDYANSIDISDEKMLSAVQQVLSGLDENLIDKRDSSYFSDRR